MPWPIPISNTQALAKWGKPENVLNLQNQEPFHKWDTKAGYKLTSYLFIDWGWAWSKASSHHTMCAWACLQSWCWRDRRMILLACHPDSLTQLSSRPVKDPVYGWGIHMTSKLGASKLGEKNISSTKTTRAGGGCSSTGYTIKEQMCVLFSNL